MRFEFLEKKDYNLIDTLVSELKLTDYEIDYDAKFLVARNGSANILGCVAINVGMKYPHLQHIILGKDTARKTGIKLLNRVEQYLKEGNYKEYTCCIDNDKNNLQVMAMRFGFQPYASSSDNSGVWFYKVLNSRRI